MGIAPELRGLLAREDGAGPLDADFGGGSAGEAHIGRHGAAVQREWRGDGL